MTNQFEPAPADPTQRPARLALYIGVILVALGLIALFLGYRGTARNPIVEAQIPFLVSGGLAGLALTLLGGVSLAAATVLRVTGEIRAELQATRDALRDGTSPVAASLQPDAAAKASTNGSVLISPAGSSYHKLDCRLVERAEVTSKVAVGEATAQGFHPCRVCNP